MIYYQKYYHITCAFSKYSYRNILNTENRCKVYSCWSYLHSHFSKFLSEWPTCWTSGPSRSPRPFRYPRSRRHWCEYHDLWLVPQVPSRTKTLIVCSGFRIPLQLHDFTQRGRLKWKQVHNSVLLMQRTREIFSHPVQRPWGNLIALRQSASRFVMRF